MQTLEGKFEIQIDEKPNGGVIRINDKRGCIIRICSIPRELVFDNEDQIRSFIDITYPKQLSIEVLKKFAKENNVAIITATQKPKNLRLSKLGERLKKQ